MTIDAHMHVGDFPLFNVGMDAAGLARTFERHAIDAGMVFYPDNAVTRGVVENLEPAYGFYWAVRVLRVLVPVPCRVPAQLRLHRRPVRDPGAVDAGCRRVGLDPGMDPDPRRARDPHRHLRVPVGAPGRPGHRRRRRHHDRGASSRHCGSGRRRPSGCSWPVSRCWSSTCTWRWPGCSPPGSARQRRSPRNWPS
jgi:hypothetical protein